MHGIRLEREIRIALPARGQFGRHRSVQVDDLPALFALRQQPVGIASEHRVVRELLLRSLIVEARRRHHDKFCARRFDLLFHVPDARLIPLETFVAQRQIDPAVDAVTGEYQIGLRRLQHAREPFGQIGTRERASRVPFFAQSRHGLAGQADVDDGRHGVQWLSQQPRFEVDDVLAAERDAIAQHHDPARSAQQLDRLGSFADRPQCEAAHGDGQARPEKGDPFHEWVPCLCLERKASGLDSTRHRSAAIWLC